jgi:hypothetical protein
MANGKSSNVSLINIYGSREWDTRKKTHNRLEVIHFEGKYAVRD